MALLCVATLHSAPGILDHPKGEGNGDVSSYCHSFAANSKAEGRLVVSGPRVGMRAGPVMTSRSHDRDVMAGPSRIASLAPEPADCTAEDTAHVGGFHKIIWGSFEGDSVGPSGVIVGGGDNGEITLYSTSQILTSGKEPAITKNGKHTGPVRALDLNPFQSNLLASGANDSEVFIWDLNNFSVPMTPGAKSQPAEDVSAVSWNQQVQHILSSAHPSGKAVVWDLRKNEPVIKVSDHSNRMHLSGMLWHPEIATQLVLSSEDDRLPVVQVWDLRFASSPLKILENHTRGILSISWSKDDPELLLSSSKDHRILCWNPSTSLHGKIAARKPLLRTGNKQKRLVWAKEHKEWTLDQWKSVLWSDESKFEIFGSNHCVFVRRRKGERMDSTCLVPTVKHGGEGVGVLCRTMTPHTSRLCKGNLTKKESDGELRQMTWPPQSPDLSPNEVVCGIVKL
ncbi:unnamed protein product [Ranitomeya imitator]|uniref:Uncharacterized protein n=1 Tax=Ranitomeya imitator TaxID=111125 RepID=A0ABN9KVD2_9NEOB|nr:unnamed protein product [Ranitomeya imitator]